MEQFIRDQSAGEGADNAEDAQKQAPVGENAFRADLFHIMGKYRVPLHDPITQHPRSKLYPREHQHERIIENFLQQIAGRIFLMHVTRRGIVRVEMRKTGFLRSIFNEPKIQDHPDK